VGTDMSGYVFWCSKCRLAHAGECVSTEAAVVPAVGSRWYCDTRFTGDLKWNQESLSPMTVLSIDLAARTVTYRYDGNLRIFDRLIEMFLETGTKSFDRPDRLIRFVRPAPGAP
jgi:hypothetical protein